MSLKVNGEEYAVTAEDAGVSLANFIRLRTKWKVRDCVTSFPTHAMYWQCELCESQVFGSGQRNGVWRPNLETGRAQVVTITHCMITGRKNSMWGRRLRCLHGRSGGDPRR